MVKKWMSGLIGLVFVSFLAACGDSGSNESSGDFSEDAPLKMWVGLNQAETYRELAEEFSEENNVEVEVIEIEEARDALLKDGEVAADVILLPHDQLGLIVESGAVYENEKYADTVKEENIPMAVEAATYQEKLYGYPASADAMFLFYDKRVYNEEDLESLDSLTEKGKIGLNIAENGADFRLTPWFIANGAQLYGETGEEVNESTLNNKQGLDVLKWIAEAKDNPDIVAVNTDEISALQQGKISALFSGVWNTKNVKEILGEDMGAAVYPKADFGDGEVNLNAFTGVPIFVVNATTKNPGKAMDLAEFVTSEESQMKAFKEINTIPSNKNARESEEVQNDEVAKTVVEMTSEEHSVLMPKLPEMKNFWVNMNALLVDTYSGKVPEAEMQSKLDKLVEDISEPVE